MQRTLIAQFLKNIDQQIRKGVRGDMAKEFKLSAERLEELKRELNYLKTVREKEVADQIKEARSFGDL